MPGFLIPVSATAQCPHGGMVNLVPNARVRISGVPLALHQPMPIAGCVTPPVPAAPSGPTGPVKVMAGAAHRFQKVAPVPSMPPCQTALPQTGALRVRSLGLPVLLSSDLLTAVPSGLPIVIAPTLVRVRGT